MIRSAKEEDLEATARVWIASWHWAYSNILPSEFIESRSDPKRRMDNLRADMAGGLLLVADEEGILGFASERPPCSLPGFDAEISGLYVAPEAARRGVGEALARAMAREFLARGSRSMAIHTLKENGIGRGFYEKIGGQLQATDEWNGFPCVWYGWDEARLTRLAESSWSP